MRTGLIDVNIPGELLLKVKMYVYVALIGLSRANNFEEFGSTYRGIVKDLI